jgi:Glycosyl hydrolases family 18
VTYQPEDQVQYNGDAYYTNAATTKRDNPDRGDPWVFLGSCDTDGGGGGTARPLSIFGVWHCGNHYCDWSVVRDTAPGGEFDLANHWIIDRGDGSPSVNLVVLSFLEPLELLHQTTSDAFADGIPVGMTKDVVEYFNSHGIRVMLSMGGITYTESWNIALTTDAAGLADFAAQAVESLGADGLEIDWENGTPDGEELAGIETFIARYHTDSNTLLTLDLAVGDRYLQELSRRAAADWLPNDKIDYINAMVPRGEPSTDQWQEHVDGKANYNPPIPPKAPAKIVVSLWLTDSNRPNDNCVDFASSTQLEKADYVQTVQPNGAGSSAGFLGYMFWAAECPSSRNRCTTPPNTCEGGMGVGASHFDIPIPIGSLRQD